MPKVNLESVEQVSRTGYPPPFNEAVAGRWYRRLAPATGLTEIGVSEVTLEPGAWSSQRHWHNGEDEFLVMVEGEAVLIEDDGQSVMGPGDLAAWPKGNTNGHHLVNESDKPCRFVVFSAGANTGGGYSDIDMMWTTEGGFCHKDGTPYAEAKRPS
jgi:uncharacterized cupin superfamily protein